MMYKILSPIARMTTFLTFAFLAMLPLSAFAQTAPLKTVTDLKQNMGENHFWMTMRTLPANHIMSDTHKPADKCFLTYIERPHFRKKINLALILSAEKNKILVQSGSAEWHLKIGEKGTLNIKAGHWVHHFNMKASKTNEITAQMPEEEMRSLLNTLSRNLEGTLEYSSGKSVRLSFQNIAPEINDFKNCAKNNHLADLGPLVALPAKKGIWTSKDQARPVTEPNKPF